jgi:hypothetical protein
VTNGFKQIVLPVLCDIDARYKSTFAVHYLQVPHGDNGGLKGIDENEQEHKRCAARDFEDKRFR